MRKTLQYPKGYRAIYDTEADGSDTRLKSGDVELNTLWEMYLSSTVNTDGWEFRERILKVAVRFFGDIKEWVHTQTINPCLYGNNYDFISDMLSFVTQGTRKLSVLSWKALLYDFPAPLPQGVKGRSLPIDMTTEVFISQWCTRPLGFEDMLCTMHVLFGDAQHAAVRTNTNCN